MKPNSIRELQHYMPGIGNAQEPARRLKAAGVGNDATVAPFGNLLPGQLATSQMAPAENIREETKSDPERKRLYDAAVEFQAVFLNMMLKSMRATLHKDQDMLYGGKTQEIFEDMLYDEYSKVLSQNERFGLAEEIYRQFSRPPSGARPEQASESPASAARDSVNQAQVEARSGYVQQMLPSKSGQ